jgi:hypothetical protein
MVSYSVPCRHTLVYTASADLGLITFQLPSMVTYQNGMARLSYVTTRVAMPSVPLSEYYVGVLDYDPASIPRLSYTSSKKGPINLHF